MAVDRLSEAWLAFDRHDWLAAYDGLARTADGALHADDFVLLAKAAYLLGRTNDCVQAMQRAHQGYVAGGDTLSAVRCAFWLAMVLFLGGEMAVGGGWVARCQRLLQDVEGDVVERGYALVHVMFLAVARGQYDEATRVSDEVTSYGRRFQDADLLAIGLCVRGRSSIYQDAVPEGLAHLDEAMVGVAAGEVSPLMAGQVWCAVIEACQEVGDFARVEQWTRALTAWCDAQPGLLTFTGQCAMHRGQVRRARGDFRGALAEFTEAESRYRALGASPAVGFLMYERGEVHRVLGEHDAAEEAFTRATELGFDPQPGLALLWLQQGRTDAGAHAVRRLLAEPRDVVHRARVLPGAIEVLLAGGDLAGARLVEEELAGIAERFGCPSLLAAAAFCDGAVALAEGDPEQALASLRAAAHAWRVLGSDYECARTMVLLGQVLRGAGDDRSAVGELEAARRTLVRLGAVPAAQAAARLLAPAALPRGLTEREVQVLRLVAGGRTNGDIAVVLFLSEKTVARHLSNIFTKIDVSSRTAAAAFAFENDLV